MKFGVKVAERTSKPTNSSGSNSDWIRYFKNTETRLRFLEEMEEWTEVWFHFSQGLMRNYPCTGERDKCPGCTSENEKEARASKKYLVNALSDGYVNLWMLPASTWDDLDRYKDKSGGTILDRDYTIIKHKGDRTTYSVDREERDRIDLQPYESKKKDHQAMLFAAFVEVHPELALQSDDLPREEKPAPRKSISLSQNDFDKLSAEQIAELDRAAGWSQTGSQASSMRDVMNEKADDDVPPSEPQPQQDQAVEEDEDQEISEDQLRAMSVPQIKALFQQCGLEAPDTDDVNVLADRLIELLS